MAKGEGSKAIPSFPLCNLHRRNKKKSFLIQHFYIRPFSDGMFSHSAILNLALQLIDPLNTPIPISILDQSAKSKLVKPFL